MGSLRVSEIPKGSRLPILRETEGQVSCAAKGVKIVNISGTTVANRVPSQMQAGTRPELANAFGEIVGGDGLEGVPAL